MMRREIRVRLRTEVGVEGNRETTDDMTMDEGTGGIPFRYGVDGRRHGP
jgi:hypothetical protein